MSKAKIALFQPSFEEDKGFSVELTRLAGAG